PEVLPGKLCRILDGRDLDLAVAEIEAVACDLHGARKAPVNGIEAQQMGVGLDRREVVDGDDLDVVTAGFRNGPHDVAADAAEPVDGNAYRHCYLPSRPARPATASPLAPDDRKVVTRGRGSAQAWPSLASAACATAPAVMPKWP